MKTYTKKGLVHEAIEADKLRIDYRIMEQGKCDYDWSFSMNEYNGYMYSCSSIDALFRLDIIDFNEYSFLSNALQSYRRKQNKLAADE